MTKSLIVPRCSREGMTLIEVMVSLLLMSLLLGVLWGLVPKFTSTAQDDSAWKDVQQTQWAHHFISRLALDLTNSTTAHVNQSSLVLTGRLARDPITEKMIDQNGQREYYFRSFHDEALLMVQQGGHRTLCGVGRFLIVLQPLTDDGTESAPIEISANSSGTESDRHPVPLPNRLRLGLRDDRGQWLAVQVLLRLPEGTDLLDTRETR